MGSDFFAASVSEIGERKGTWWGFVEIALLKFGLISSLPLEVPCTWDVLGPGTELAR